jgi:hypothetical protein
MRQYDGTDDNESHEMPDREHVLRSMKFMFFHSVNTLLRGSMCH